MRVPDAPALFEPAPGAAATRRALAALAGAGALAHAAFLPISIAGMQLGLGCALAGLVGLRLAGAAAWSRSALDLPCLLLPLAAVASLGLGTLAGSPPVGWQEATLWRSLLAPPVLLSAIAAAGGAPAGGPGARRLALAVLATWAVAALLPSALAWIQYRTGLDPLHALGLRDRAVEATVPIYPDRHPAMGFFRWYPRFAQNLTPPLCLAAALALHGGLRPRLRALLALAALAAAAAVVLTLSRGAWTALLVALLVIVGLHRPWRRWAAPAAALAAAAMMALPGVRVRLAHLAVPGDNADRAEIWSVCRAMVRDRPLTGVGWGNLPRRSAPYYAALAPANALGGHAWCHDAYLTAWAEGGPLLFLALLASGGLLAAACWRWWRAARDPLARAAAVGGLAALATAAVNGLVHDVLQASEAVYGLGFALAVAAALTRPPPTGTPPRSRAQPG